jgi:hypothetical protein
MVTILCGIFLPCQCQVLTRLSWSSSQVRVMMIFSTLHFCSSFTFGSRQRREWFRMIAPAVLCFSIGSTNLCILMQLQHSKCASQTLHPPLMMDTSHRIYALWVWLIRSTLMLVHVHTLWFRAFIELLAWKLIWLNGCQFRDLLLLLALMPAIVIVHLIERAEVLGHPCCEPYHCTLDVRTMNEVCEYRLYV